MGKGGACGGGGKEGGGGIQNPPPPSSIRCGERIRYCGEKEIEGCGGLKVGIRVCYQAPAHLAIASEALSKATSIFLSINFIAYQDQETVQGTTLFKLINISRAKFPS